MNRAAIELKNATIPVSDTLRVASLNLLNQHDNLQQRLDGLVSEINRLDIDVLCLQEVLANSDIDIAQYLITHTEFEYAHAATPKVKENGDSYGTLTLAKTKFTVRKEERYHQVFALGFSIIPATYTVLQFNNREVHILNCHLVWGSAGAPLRMHQTEILDGHAKAIRRADPDAIILLAGDFNAEDDASNIRFLTGLQSSDHGVGTLWVDAWRMHGTEHNRVTSDPETYWGAHTGARKSGLFNLDMIPKRRIDFLLAYDWCYGKAGSPLSFARFADTLTGDSSEISDHFGILTDIWVPQPD